MSLRDDFTDCETDVRIDGKVALVTGATSGTGLEIARNLANRGAKVIIASRNLTKLANARNTKKYEYKLIYATIITPVFIRLLQNSLN